MTASCTMNARPRSSFCCATAKLVEHGCRVVQGSDACPSGQRWGRFYVMRRYLLAFAAVVSLSATGADAADYPSRAITIIVPFAPGGSNDIVARAIGQKMNEDWDQAVVVDNRPGAGGVIGSEFVARAAPDGYTLLLVSSTFTINPAVKAS